MPRPEPTWWYDGARAESLPARLLAPIAAVVAHVAGRRIANARPFQAKVPVLCVGNFTVGGTGKTPMTRLLVELLASRGETPVVLSRGYGGRLEGPVAVDIGTHSARDVGDEPLLLARSARVVVARDRAAGARAIAAMSPAPSVIVMDDGLQNQALAKDLTFALVDAQRGLGNGKVMPSGPLRAALEVQLGLADAIVITGAANNAHERALREALSAEFKGPLLRAHPQPMGDTAWIKDAPLVAFAGIAAPSRFFDLLQTLGGRLVAAEAFPDHRPLSDADCKALLARAERDGATLVTTEKDLARLDGRGGAGQDLAARTRILPIGLVLDAADLTTLGDLVTNALARARKEP